MMIRRIVVSVLIVTLTMLLMLVALEFGVRSCRPQKHFAVCVNQWDREVGTKHIPGMKGFIICPEYEIDLVINSRGLRDREFSYEKPGDTKRILVLGDSYVCGYGVQAEQTFAKVLEELLNSGSTQTCNWEVLNAGIGSTGTAHQLAFFNTEGYRYNADIVVVCFCPANDFNDNVISGLYSIQDGKLVKHDAPETTPRKLQKIAKLIPGYSTFLAKSHFWNFLKRRMAILHYKVLYKKSARPKGSDQSNAGDRYRVLAKRLMEELDGQCAKYGSRLVVMSIPPPKASFLPEWTKDLFEHLNSRNIPCLDLDAYFEEKTQQNIVTFHPADGHWNPEGHHLAAEKLHEFLLEKGMLGGHP